LAIYTHFRGFDLTHRIAKIERAFRREPLTSAEEFPVLINAPCYFSFGSRDKPRDYYTNPASMLAYQTHGYETHLSRVQDDTVPYFMPWFGTGVLASAFGAPVHQPDNPADDPAVLESRIKCPGDIVRLKLPDPERDGWMPRVLKTIDYAVTYGEMPVGLTDMQGPLDTVGMLCGQAQLYKWMYSEPAMIHDLFDIVTEAFIQWVKVQKQHIGEPLERSNGLQGAFSPGCGVWESDDDLVLIDSDLYREFVVPYVSRIFDTFNGGSIHFCGSGVQHLDTFRTVSNLRVINNSPLGNFAAFTRLARSLAGEVTLQIQDAAPVDVEGYYANLFAEVDDFRGMMLATFVLDNAGMDGAGGYVPVEWDAFQTSNRIVASIRNTIARRLAGEDTRPVGSEAGSGSVAIEQSASRLVVTQSEFNPQQQAALERVRDNLIIFDQDEVKQAVQAALKLEIRPFDIILQGLALGMQEVGRLYELGDYFLPQLVMAGATMQAAMGVLQPSLQGSGGTAAISKGKVILGTVKGDLHDIGKNLVRTMLEGASFEVIDLGVDVPPQKFVEAAKSHGAQLVALSALLTTTLQGMQQTVEALKAAGLAGCVRVMIGGAPVSREYADQIGAEGYAASAVGAIAEAERLLGYGNV